MEMAHNYVTPSYSDKDSFDLLYEKWGLQIL